MSKKRENTEQAADDFTRQAETKAPSLLRELWDFVCCNKKWWLVPIIVVLLLVSVLVLLTANSALAPFIYAIF